MEKRSKVSFLVFFLIWADIRGWKVPDVHIRAILWFQKTWEIGDLRCFRGFGKSTILAIRNAYLYYCDPHYRILHQSADDQTAYKTSRDTQNVLRRHPLTKHLIGKIANVEQWWVAEAKDNDARNASFYAKGIMSNVTSSRANECQNDDVEVPRNIKTPELRENLRYRLGEQTHILIPGGRKLFIGTPHTHDSIYDEMEALGADCLTIKLFEEEYRIDKCSELEYFLPFEPEYVFSGIGKYTKFLEKGIDYTFKNRKIEFVKAHDNLVDFYAGNAWPERFTKKELVSRRKQTETINEWDSQYQLHSKPVHEIRLDPEWIKAYDMHPRIEYANKQAMLMLGNVHLVSGRAYWDPSEGKLTSDDSAFSILFDDTRGNHYWHVCDEFTGPYAVFSDSKNTKIISGQVIQACEYIKRFNVLHVYVENNGVGSFVGPLLKQALKQSGLVCGVTEVHSSDNKNTRILSGLEAPMKSGVLWAHVDVLNGSLWDQMKDWKPSVKEQPDGLLDSGAGALLQAPVRINKNVGFSTPELRHDWRQNSGVYEAEFER